MAGTHTLGATIRARRCELGLTQEALAELIGDGVRQSDVSRLERGKVALPRFQRLQALAAALGLPPGELLARSGWTGAAEALPPTPPAVNELPGGNVEPEPKERPPAMLAQPLPTPRVASARLRSALMQSKDTRARTEKILQQVGQVCALAADPATSRVPFAEFAGHAEPRCDSINVPDMTEAAVE